MGGNVQDHNGNFCADKIQNGFAGMGLFIQEVVVISETHSDVLGSDFVVGDEALHGFCDVSKAAAFGQICHQGHLAVHGDVAVGIQEAGHQAVSFQIYLAEALSGKGGDLCQSTCFCDLSVFDQDRFRIVTGIFHGNNRTAVVNGVHTAVSLCYFFQLKEGLPQVLVTFRRTRYSTLQAARMPAVIAEEIRPSA